MSRELKYLPPRGGGADDRIWQSPDDGCLIRFQVMIDLQRLAPKLTWFAFRCSGCLLAGSRHAFDYTIKTVDGKFFLQCYECGLDTEIKL